MKTLYTKIILASLILFFTKSLSAQNTVSFYTIPETICGPTSVGIFNTSIILANTGGPYYEWKIDGVVFDNKEIPPAQLLSQGNYNIELTISDDLGQLGYYSEMVNILGQIDTFYVRSGLTACPGEELIFSVDGDPYMIDWDFGDGSVLTGPSQFENYARHSYSKEGIYTVNLYVENDCGGVNLSQDIEIISTATPQFTPYIMGSSIICPNEEVQFDVDGDFASYLWDFGDGTNSTKKNPIHTYTDQDAANYTVNLTVTNLCGNTNTESLMVNIDFNPVTDAGFNYNMETPYSDPCPGTSVFFHSHSSGTHQWKFGDGGISGQRDPIYTYSTPGSYTVEHILTSGCGLTDVSSQQINVVLNPEEVAWNVNFTFDLDMNWEELQFLDTLTVCPGELVTFKNSTYYPYQVFYNWDFGDGGFLMGNEAQHKYDTPGLYEVVLTATTGCGGVSTVSKYVVVDAGKKPDAQLGIVPMVICPDETVYFFDDNFDPKNNYKYHIDFGDGEVLNDITEITELELYTLTSHQYSGAGPFNFSFKAENSCGNITENAGTITVNPDDTRKPFYYVFNSTEDEDQREPADWSVQNDDTDHQLDILVDWTSWQASYGDTFYIYFWYGGMITDGEQEVPDGVVKFQSSNIASGETVIAWAPMNMLGPNDVGIAAGYFCGEMKFQEEPDAWGTLMDGEATMITSIPLTPSGYTNITDISPFGIQIDPTWDGICKSELPEGTWFREVSPGVFAVLDLYEDMPGSYYYFMEYRDDVENWTESNYISGGPYIYPGYPDISSIEFQDEGCGGYIPYNFIKPTEDQLQFFPSDDGCSERVAFLDGVFQKYGSNNFSPSVCPNDIVDFQIAGGLSYVWDFGDGSPTSNLQYPDHSYAEPGNYDAFVTATNSCGRVDVINSKVTISSDNLPNASFYVENMNIFRMDTIWFNPNSYDDYGGITDNNSYLWEFGDGKTSTKRDPFHVFSEAGRYQVSLSVSNNCGTSKFDQEIIVKEIYLLCEAKFNFDMDGLNVGFTDLSAGNPTNWDWDFGDGTFSDIQNPDHDYPADGIYFVKLTTFNDQNECVSSVVRKLEIGNIVCDAGFTFIVNNNSGLVKFINTSLNGGSYFWDFGDNSVSNLQNPEHTYKNSGLYTACLTIIDDASGCQSSFCATVLVGADSDYMINADFSYFPATTGLGVSFSDLSVGNITNWYWTTGDGKTINKSSFAHTYEVAGIYEVCLIVFDENTGLSDEICKTVRVGADLCDLSADFDFFVKSSSNELTLADMSTGNAERWYWTFGDGYTSEAQNPKKHQYNNPGFYLVTLSVFDATNDCMDHTAKFLQVGDVECKADFKVQINAETKEVRLQNTSTGPIEKYYWDFGNGRYSTLKSPSFTYHKPGKYNIGLTVIDSAQVCLDYTVKEVQLGEINCSAAFDYYVDSLSATAYFHNKIMGDYSQMLWIFGDGTYSTKANPVHQFTAPGYYTVSLNTFNSVNNCMDYYETTLLVGSEGIDCQSNFIFQPGDAPNTIRFKDQSNGIVQDFVWSFGDGNNSQELNPVHTYPEPGYYLTCLTIWNNYNIPNINCRWVPVETSESNDCRANFMFSVDSMSLNAVFTDNSYGNPDTWQWDFGDGTRSNLQNPRHSYTEKGYYTVKLVSGNSVGGCRSVEVKLLNVGEENKLKVAFDYEADSSNLKAAGYPIDFVGTTSGDASSYEWDFGDDQLKSFTVMDSTTRIVTHYYELPGVYTACLRASDKVTNQSDVYCLAVETANAVNTIDVIADKAELNVYPNPASDYTNINYSLPANLHIEIAIFDAMGKRVETLVRTEKEKGDHKITWDSDSVRPGLYFIKLMTSEQIITQGLVVNK